ncbi:MAG: YHS domain protein [Rhodobacteraceae bacterium]|nr:YHS domain protein [Paracoccaceae bacterium]
MALPLAVRADTPIFYTGGASAINGYDTVAYFTMGESVKGKENIAVMWKGVIWRFASQSNREKFEANPRAFAPQYGGYCAYEVSNGNRVPSEPKAWVISDGKLYLIRTIFSRALWQLDAAGHIERANANWPDVLDE